MTNPATPEWQFTGKPHPPDIGSGQTSELLKPLSDDELAEYCRHWVWNGHRYKGKGDGYGSWQCSNRLSTAYGEVRRRGIDVDALDAALEADYNQRH